MLNETPHKYASHHSFKETKLTRKTRDYKIEGVKLEGGVQHLSACSNYVQPYTAQA